MRVREIKSFRVTEFQGCRVTVFQGYSVDGLKDKENEEKRILFGEVKWFDEVNAKKLFKELEEKTKCVKWFNNERI